MGKDWSTTGKEVKKYKDGTLIFIPDDVDSGVFGILLNNDDSTWSDTCYKIYWMDDNSDVLYGVSHLEAQINKNKIQVIYEP